MLLSLPIAKLIASDQDPNNLSPTGGRIAEEADPSYEPDDEDMHEGELAEEEYSTFLGEGPMFSPIAVPPGGHAPPSDGNRNDHPIFDIDDGAALACLALRRPVWFQDLDPEVRDEIQRFFADAANAHRGFNEEAAADAGDKWGLSEAQVQELADYFTQVTSADEAESAVIQALVTGAGRRRSVKTAGYVWNLADKYERTYPGPVDGDNGVGPLGSVDVDGFTTTILPMLAQEKSVVELGTGGGQTACGLAARHNVIGFEVVPSRHACGERMHEHLLRKLQKKKISLNALKFGTHKHKSGIPFYAVCLLQYLRTWPLWRHRVWRGDTVVPRASCTLCEDNEAVSDLCRTLFCVLVLCRCDWELLFLCRLSWSFELAAEVPFCQNTQLR
jgi:hypothetical protein